MFDNMIFYINSNIHPDLSQTLKHLISVNGGFWLDEFTLVTTHILTDYLKEQEYVQLKSLNSLTFVLKVEWLIDCIYLDKKIDEEDYLIRSFKGNQPQRAILKISHALGEDSSSLYSYQKTTTLLNQQE